MARTWRVEDRAHGRAPEAPAAPPWKSWALLGLLVAALAAGGLFWKLQDIDRRLSEASGFGIVALQLAGSADRARLIIQTWHPSSGAPMAPERAADGTPLIDQARTGVLVDFAFIPAYTLTLLLLLQVSLIPLLPRSRRRRLFLALPVAAGALDIAENLLLLQILGSADPAPQALVTLTTLAAGTKFLLILAAATAPLSLLGFWLFHWQRERDPRRRHWAFIKPVERVLRNEARYLRSRRWLAGLRDSAALEGAPVGLSLSGGGIRSATLCLGVLQRLMRNDFFRHLDYLSTVSGGGYIGTALSSLLSAAATKPDATAPREYPFVFTPEDRPQFEPGGAKAPFADPPWDTQTRARPWLDGGMVVTHLRAFGDYLARRRRLLDRDVLRAAGSLVAGIGTSLLLFLLLALLLASALLVLVLWSHAEALLLAERGCDSALPSFASYLWCLRGGTTPIPFSIMGGIGLLFLSVIATVGSLVADACPDDWLLRDGDTPEESRQYRLLWISGGLGLASGFRLSAPISSQLAMPATLLSPLAFFLGGTLAAALAYLILVGSPYEAGIARSDLERRSFVAASLTLCLYALVMAAVLALLPWLLQTLGRPLPGHHLSTPAGISLAGGLAAGLMAWLGRHRADPKRLQEGLTWLKQAPDALRRLVLGVAVALLIAATLVLGLAVIRMALDVWWLPDGLAGAVIVTAALGIVFTLVGFAVDFNKLSLHYFYRDRLVDAFLRTSARPRTAYGRDLELKRDHGEMRLTDLHGVPVLRHRIAHAQDSFIQYEAVRADPEPCRTRRVASSRIRARRFPGAATGAPYHLYATCLNLATERDMRFRARKSDVFVFSKLYCGSSATGYVDTGVYRSGETKVARVMTISGAAVDSALGRDTFFAQAFATTLFNIRLGQWMENPAYRAGNRVCRQERGIFWPFYLLMEALGMSDSRHRLIRLSDGGHSGDNLGLIPLLQRRCRLILAVDAEQDPGYRCASLMNAIRYAETELGIAIDLRLEPLRPNESGLAAQHFVIGCIRYPETPHAAAQDGCLVVLKPSITEADAAPIQQFRLTNPRYPQETTADQFFSEDQFEAYRQLGRAMADALLAAHPRLERGELRCRPCPAAPAWPLPAQAHPEPSQAP